MDGVNFPFGKATSVTLAPLATGAAAATISDNFTFIELGTLGAATTLTLTASAEIRVGARVVVKALSDGTARTVTFAGDCTSATMAGVISKTKTKELVWNGSKFIGLNEQID